MPKSNVFCGRTSRLPHPLLLQPDQLLPVQFHPRVEVQYLIPFFIKSKVKSQKKNPEVRIVKSQIIYCPLSPIQPPVRYSEQCSASFGWLGCRSRVARGPTAVRERSRPSA